MPDKQTKHPMRRPGQPKNAHGRVRSFAVILTTVGLYCLAGVFIFLAIFWFISGIWRLFVAGGLIVAYGDLTHTQWERLFGQLTGAFLLPYLSGVVAGLCTVTAKRLGALRDFANKTDDVRAPVIYLRSFDEDEHFGRRRMGIVRILSVRTEEEELVTALREIGPVVAIGKPGEPLPRLGAQRIYVEDSDWQQQIRAWFTRAALVVVQVPPVPTQGVTWEIDESLNSVALDQLVFLVSQGTRITTSLDWINHKLQDHGLMVKRVTNLRPGPYGSDIFGIIHFENGRAEFRPLVKPPFFKRPFLSPIVPVYRAALQPVTTRITGSWQPLSRAFGGAFIAAVWIAFCTAIIALGLYGRLTDPWGVREGRIFEQRLLRQLPADVQEELAKNPDQAAIGAWIKTQNIQNGLRYVPDDVVLAMANIVRRLLAIASPANCAALANRTLVGPALDELVNELFKQDRTARTTWFNCYERLILESVKSQHPETFPVSEAEAKAAFALLYEGLSEKDRATYNRITADFEKASADDRCWFAQALLQGVAKLEEPSSGKLARVGLGQDIEN